MPNAVRPIPEGYHTITPQLTCRGAARAIDFYKSVFGAQEITRMDGPGGKVMHAELKIGDSRFMLNDEMPGMSVAPSPSPMQPSSLLTRRHETVQHVLGRSFWQIHRSLWSPMGRGHTCRRCIPRRNEASRGRNDQADGQGRHSLKLASLLDQHRYSYLP